MADRCVPASPDPVKIGLNGYPGYAGVVRGNAIARARREAISA